MEMFYGMKDPFVETSDRTKVVLAAFTTAKGPHQVVQGYARLGSARVLLRYGQYHLHGERG